MDNQAPGLNFSVGTIVGLNELDVDNMELLPGASSALYGPGGMNGTLLINSSLIDRKPHRTDVKTHYVPCNDIAQELGNLKVANMVMVGAIIAASGVVNIDSVITVLAKKIFKNKPKVMPINEQAIRRGLECVTGK